MQFRSVFKLGLVLFYQYLFVSCVVQKLTDFNLTFELKKQYDRVVNLYLHFTYQTLFLLFASSLIRTKNHCRVPTIIVDCPGNFSFKIWKRDSMIFKFFSRFWLPVPQFGFIPSSINWLIGFWAKISSNLSVFRNFHIWKWDRVFKKKFSFC